MRYIKKPVHPKRIVQSALPSTYDQLRYPICRANISPQKSIELTVMEAHYNKTITYPITHNMHYLDSLREDIMGHADDTPRYTTTGREPISGVGQMRQRRDWGKLEEWAQSYSACWRYLGLEADNHSELERYLYCAPDSPDYARMPRWKAKHFRNETE